MTEDRKVIHMLSRQPIITHAEAIRITSASKPEIVAIQTDLEQRDWLYTQDWQLMELTNGIWLARNPKFMWGMWISCERAVDMQENVNLGRIAK